MRTKKMKKIIEILTKEQQIVGINVGNFNFDS